MTGKVFQLAVGSSRYIMMAVLFFPVLAGLLGVLLPAFGWLPALGRDNLNLIAFQDFFATPGINKMLWLTMSTGFFSTLLAFIFTISILATFYNSSWLNRVQTLFSPILVIPHAAAAIALAFLVTPSGLFSRLVSPWLTEGLLPPDYLMPNDSLGLAMIFGLALKELPFLLLMSLSVLAQPDIKYRVQKQYQLALSLGYWPSTAFLKVIFPSLYGLIRLPVLAVLAYASSTVEIPLILGPNNPPTLAVAILHWFNDVDLTMRFKASAGAIVQLGLTLLLLSFWWSLEWLAKFFVRECAQ